MEIEEEASPASSENATVETPTTGNQPGEQGQSTTDANPNPEQPSSTPGSDAKADSQKNMASVVEAALKGEKGASSPSEKQPVGQKPKVGEVDPKAAAGDKKPGDKKIEDGKDAEIPKEFHKHPAWQKLKSQRDELRVEAEKYKSDAVEFQAITGFMQQHDIQPEQVANIMHLIVLQNTDPVKFYETVAGFKGELDAKMGLVLPADLQARVDAGEISEEDAKALNSSKAQAKLLKDRQTETTERNRTREAQTNQRQTLEAMANTVNKWEEQIQTRDPDYPAKREFVQAEIRAYIQQAGMPKTVQHAVKYAELAYETVTKRLTGVLPQRKPNSPTPQTGRQTETTFVPKSVEDVVSHVLQGGG